MQNFSIGKVRGFPNDSIFLMNLETKGYSVRPGIRGPGIPIDSYFKLMNLPMSDGRSGNQGSGNSDTVEKLKEGGTAMV